MNDSSLSITIVIPAKDPGSVLNDCLKAILQQRIPSGWSLAVVVVDDGSDIPVSVKVESTHSVTVSVLRSTKNEG